MSDEVKELDLWWIVSGREKSSDKDSTVAEVQAAYNKHLRKFFRTTPKIRNAIGATYLCPIYFGYLR